MFRKALFALVLSCSATGYSEEPAQEESEVVVIEEEQTPEPVATDPTPAPEPVVQASPKTQSISAFTGKILRNKVRMRLQPSLDGFIVREFNTGDLVLVVGEAGDFYAVEPPADLKAYIFRTYVLDGVIEGNRVNVRLEPDLSAPVIAQLNSGDPVKGTISGTDKKWVEITPPSSTRFYIAKEFVDKAGDATILSKLKKRHEEVLAILDNARQTSQIELQKPFEQIRLEIITQKLNDLISKYADFPQESAKAKELLNNIQSAYLNKKVAHMESEVQSASRSKEVAQEATTNVQGPPAITSKMASWLPHEQFLYDRWIAQSGKGTWEEFYQVQEQNGTTLRGIIEPYTRAVKNKPGDFVLIHPKTHLPIAYLYSTQVNLQERIGQELSVRSVPRDNQSFAYPAYFVLSVE